jgi:hypothetical protein|nr:MAG TPA: hypothetical protein [Caudoviricetes sp.]
MDIKELSNMIHKAVGESYAKVFEETNKKKIKPMSEQAKIVQDIKARKANRLLADRKETVEALNNTINYFQGRK